MSINVEGASSSVAYEYNNRFSIRIEEGLSVEVVREKIRDIKEPQVILWYFGAYGLKENGAKFYRDNLLEIVHYPNNPTAWLYDLTAWAAFKNSKIPISRYSTKTDDVEGFMKQSLKCIRASELFSRMQTLPETPMEYFKNHVFTRESLKKPSELFPVNNLTVRQIFQDSCPALEPFYEEDTAKAYSAVQYLELFLLVEKIIQDRESTLGDLNIVLALPNDESKYYKGNPILEDLNIFLSDRFDKELEQRNINIHIMCFEYGTESFHRPYNAIGKVIKKHIKLDEVIPKEVIN